MAYEDVIAAIEQALEEQQTPGEEEAAVQSGVPISRYVAGLTNDVQLRGELSALGYKGIRLDRLVLAAQLKRELDLFNDRLAIKRQQLKDKVITLSEFTTWLEDQGVDGESVIFEISRAEAGVPTAVLKSVAVTLRLVSVEEIPARPVEQPVSLTLRVTSAEVVAAALLAEVQPVMLSLRITEAELVPEVEVESVQLFLDILKIEEAPYGSQSPT